jgi:hypothetical protein
VAEHMLPGFNPQHQKLNSYKIAPNAIELLEVLFVDFLGVELGLTHAKQVF